MMTLVQCCPSRAAETALSAGLVLEPLAMTLFKQSKHGPWPREALIRSASHCCML